jgi:hypothetical protein
VAIAALERAGILSWVNRIHRIRVRERDLFGQWVTSWRVLRTSNAYVFRDPKETLSGARLVAAPVNGIKETSEALMLRSGWFHGSRKG